MAKINDRLLNDALDVDHLLHETIIDEVGNELLSNVWKVNLDRIKMIRLHGHYTANRILPAMQEHLEIIRPMKSRDPEGAVAELEKHLNTSMMRALGLRK